MRKHEDATKATQVLEQLIEQWPAYLDAYLLLGDICEKQENWKKAESVYRKALKLDGLGQDARLYLEARLKETIRRRP